MSSFQDIPHEHLGITSRLVIVVTIIFDSRNVNTADAAYPGGI